MKLRPINKKNFVVSSVQKYTFLNASFGEGTFGRVFHEVKNKRFVIKCATEDKYVDQLKHEFEILLKIPPHCNIVYCYGFHSMRVGIVLEYVDGPSLMDIVYNSPRPNDIEIVRLFLEIGSALLHVHSHHIIHNDIKLENILLTKRYVTKLCDFGLSKFTPNDENIGCIGGTPDYLSPQFLLGIPSSYERDTWAFVVMLYEIIYKRPPFTSNAHIIRCTYEPCIPSSFADGIFRQSFIVDFTKRLTLSELMLLLTKFHF